MTPEQIIQRVRELDKAATPGPWADGPEAFSRHAREGRRKRPISAGAFGVQANVYGEYNAKIVAESRTLLPALADAYDAQARKLAEVEDERDALKAKVAKLTFTHDELIVMREAMRRLDVGAHYCRYCNAGTHNQWDHSESCPYMHSVKVVERARLLMDRLQAIMKGDQ